MIGTPAAQVPEPSPSPPRHHRTTIRDLQPRGENFPDQAGLVGHARRWNTIRMCAVMIPVAASFVIYAYVFVAP